MKAQITITWNPENGQETKISTSQAWKELTPLEKADCLKDALGDLLVAYNIALEQMDEESKNIRDETIRRDIRH